MIMNVTESEVKTAVASILTMGLHRIRNYCRKNPDFADAEAYHLHNLPGLLRSFSVPLLKHYADIERPGYLRTVGSNRGKTYEEEWKIIDDFLKEN